MLSVPVTAGPAYLVEQPSSPTPSLPFAQVTGTKATSAKHLGRVQLGLDPAAAYSSLAASFNDVGITADTNTAPGGSDGGGASFSETALTNAHAAPGATITSSGVTFTFLNVAAGSDDNTVAGGALASGTAAQHIFALATTGSASGGSVISLRAHADNMIVTADNAGSSPLIADRTAIGPWEEFDLIHD